MAATEPTVEATTVLEFGLGSDRDCLDIDVIDETVDAVELTRIPNSPPIDGVMDLRRKTTTVDPRTVFDIDESGSRDRIVVFDENALEEGGTVDWMVDEVFQVSDVDAENVD